MKDKLTAQQALFVEYYCSGMTAKDAYIKAGYKPKNDDVARHYAVSWTTIKNIIDRNTWKHI